MVWRMARACVVFKFYLRLRQFRHKNESTTLKPRPRFVYRFAINTRKIKRKNVMLEYNLMYI